MLIVENLIGMPMQINSRDLQLLMIHIMELYILKDLERELILQRQQLSL